MKDVDIPARFGTVFASQQIAPYIRDVPDSPGAPGAASLQKGFPGPACFTPPTAGGIPPFGQDFNGLLKRVTAWSQWQAAGAPAFYDSTFSAAINGYPKGALLASSSVDGLIWRSIVDDNATNPDAAGAGWVVSGSMSISEITAAGAGTISPATIAGALWVLLEFTGGGGGGGTGDGGSGGSSGTFADGAAGNATVVNGITAAAGGAGLGGRAAGNTQGGAGGNSGGGTNLSIPGGPGNCGIWTPSTAAGNIGGNGGGTFFSGGGLSASAAAFNGTKGSGGAGGKCGDSNSYTGGGGGGGETRILLLKGSALVALLGSGIAYNIGSGGLGGIRVGNFPGGNGGDGYLRITVGF